MIINKVDSSQTKGIYMYILIDGKGNKYYNKHFQTNQSIKLEISRGLFARNQCAIKQKCVKCVGVIIVFIIIRQIKIVNKLFHNQIKKKPKNIIVL